MKIDTLFLLDAPFRNPALEGAAYYCTECMLLEGLLTRFAPALENRLRVERVAWPRPRAALIERFGEAHQDLPMLVLSAREPPPFEHVEIGSHRACVRTRQILPALSALYGLPLPHP